MINIIDFIFINLAFVTTFTGVLILRFEKIVPAFIKKGFQYGCFAYQGSDANFLQVLEIPKSYYRHFYLFSSVFSSFSLIYMILVYFFEFGVNRHVFMALKLLLQNNDQPMSISAALMAMVLLTVQCLRRFYETYYLQVFAKSSKMNFSHYLAGIVHYFACIVVVLGYSPMFCGSQNIDEIKWSDSRTSYVALPLVAVFLWAWYEQYQSNVIFANLRKDKKSGAIVTEKHSIPCGRMFEYISSPHRLCEVIIYTLLICLLPTRTFFIIYLWVLSNQIQTAVQAHEWYKKTFKNYPTNRYAIIPRVL